MVRFVASAVAALYLATSIVASKASNDSEAGKRIKVALYYESQCPGCRQVLTSSFKEAFATPSFLKMADVTLVPYGNAKETPSSKDGSTYDFDCQHGPSECRYNAVEACALSKIACPIMAFNFINCIENYDESREADQDYGLVVNACASLTGVADLAADIEECSTGAEGNGLVHQNALQTEALDPPHTYVPWITVNNKHDEDVQNDISDSLLKYVCDHYHGPDKSPYCAAFPNDETIGIRGAPTTTTGAALQSKVCPKASDDDTSILLSL